MDFQTRYARRRLEGLKHGTSEAEHRVDALSLPDVVVRMNERRIDLEMGAFGFHFLSSQTLRVSL